MKSGLLILGGAATLVIVYLAVQPKPRPQAPAVPKVPTAVPPKTASPSAAALPKAKPVAPIVPTAKAATNQPNAVVTPSLSKPERSAPAEYEAPTVAARPASTTVVASVYKGAHIRFDTENLNYGVIAKGSNGKRKFRFVNDGSEPIVIANVLPGCHCVSANPPKEPIEPGKAGYIEVEYDTTIEGDFTKDFIVTSNADGDETKIIYIKGTVR